MDKFKNFVLRKYYKELSNKIVFLDRGEVGGYSIEIETRDPTSFDSYVYNGKSAKDDREFDFELLKSMLKTSAE